jgi:hypothetical protein
VLAVTVAISSLKIGMLRLATRTVAAPILVLALPLVVIRVLVPALRLPAVHILLPGLPVPPLQHLLLALRAQAHGFLLLALRLPALRLLVPLSLPLALLRSLITLPLRLLRIRALGPSITILLRRTLHLRRSLDGGLLRLLRLCVLAPTMALLRRLWLLGGLPQLVRGRLRLLRAGLRRRWALSLLVRRRRRWLWRARRLVLRAAPRGQPLERLSRSLAGKPLLLADADRPRRHVEHAVNRLREVGGGCPADRDGGDKPSRPQEKRPQCRTDNSQTQQHLLAIPQRGQPQHLRA